jgi:hypothetical protein
MKIHNMTNDLNIRDARNMVMMHLKDETFLEMVKNVASFNHTASTPMRVSMAIDDFEGEVFLRQYRPFNPWTKAIAYAELPNIYFNSRKSFPAIDRAETICHEIMHLLGYSHKGNYVTKYNLDSVPYKVAALFRKHLESIYG